MSFDHSPQHEHHRHQGASSKEPQKTKPVMKKSPQHEGHAHHEHHAHALSMVKDL